MDKVESVSDFKAGVVKKRIEPCDIPHVIDAEQRCDPLYTRKKAL